MCTENAKFTCPEPGKGCQYWHYDIGSKITVTHDGVSTEVKLHVAPSEYTDSLSACIGPLHWFNDWPRLIAFIELWRRQGTHTFLVSVQSVSKSVQQVIDYYVDKYDPNFKTFYVSDNLEFQHCIFWSKSKYTFLGDVDDFIYIRNRSYNYFDYLEKWLAEKSDFGALKFSHVGLTFRPRIVENPFIYENFLTFDSFRNPITFDNWRFPKTIFLTKAVKANWVHYPNEYFLGKTAYEAPKEEALHLHGRYDFDLREDINESSKLYPDVQFFEPNKIDNTLKEIGAIVREIFHGETPEYRGALAHDAVERCRNTGWSAQSGCLEPGVSCFDDLFPLDHWVLAEPNEDGHYVII
ncbi:unnamed protein product, partial [Mesorhabditis belari]|uniref:Glycosyltransferase family 92 protein n=1 Tax=Mesorhabditis belari TaxID=2138241 RepID=A0AAF3FCF5_9BILA